MKRKSPDPAAVGAKVLRNLAKGRAKLHEDRRAQATFWRRIIADYVLLDLRDGGSRRGRAQRIACKLRHKIGERMVRRYLASLASSSDSAC